MKTNVAGMIDFFFIVWIICACFMSTNEVIFLVIFALRVKIVCRQAAYMLPFRTIFITAKLL